MFVSIQTVRKNDTIRDTYLDSNRRLQVEKGPAVKVGKVEFDHCSKRGVHINGRECYDNTALVWRERSEPFVNNNGPSENDWDIDNNIPVSDPRSPFNPGSEEEFIVQNFNVQKVSMGQGGIEIQFQIKDGLDPDVVNRQAAIYQETMRQMSLYTPNEMKQLGGY